MSEHGQQDSSIPALKHSDDEEARTMPLGIGDSDSEMVDSDAFLGEEAGKKRSLSSGTIVLLAVVVVAGAGLYSMRTLGTVSASGGVATDLEQTIESFLDTLRGDSRGRNRSSQQVVGTVEGDVDGLVDNRTELQVSLDDVQKNPFVLFQSQDTSDAPATVDNTAELEAARRAAITATRQRFDEAAGRFRLSMVMGGAEPMASVDGRIVYIGDTIIDERANVEFTVIEITPPGEITIRAIDPGLDIRHDVIVQLQRAGTRPTNRPRR